jgi:hypothetical protein
MSSDPPPRRSSRLSNKRTVVPDDDTESVAMTVTKRRGKRTDAGRRHTMTCTFVIDEPHILYAFQAEEQCAVHARDSMQRCYEITVRELYAGYCMHTVASRAKHVP